MDELLTLRPSGGKSTGVGLEVVQEQTTKTTPLKRAHPTPSQATPHSPESCLETLRQEPDYQSLTSTLRLLARDQIQDASSFSIRKPSPLSAQLVQVLVSEIVPNYWAILKEGSGRVKSSPLQLLLSCLRSITGINAILVRLKALIQEAKSEATGKVKRPDIALNLDILLDLLSRLINGDACVADIWKFATEGLGSQAKLRPVTQEILSIFGSGRIVSLAAEAESVARAESLKGATEEGFWPADGLQYIKWLGQNIVKGALQEAVQEYIKFLSDLFAKSLKIGHPGKTSSLLFPLSCIY